MEQPAATRDALTGLPGRAAFDERLQRLLDISRQQTTSLTMLVLDLDHFKSINDAFGHTRGDEVLIEFARRLNSVTRTSDEAFRYGGDEFVLLLPQTGLEQGVQMAQRLLDTVRLRQFDGTPPLSLSLSVGVATYPEDAETSDDLFSVADQRHYAAKRAGRSQVVGKDATQRAPVSIEGPSRIIERDPALEQVQRVLSALPNENRAVLQVVGKPGSGLTRMLGELARAFRLQGYEVLSLHGSAALQERRYGALTEAVYAIDRDLPLPSRGVATFSGALVELLTADRFQGLLITLDNPAEMDTATLDFVHALFQQARLPRLAVAYATVNPAAYRSLPQESPLRVQITLKPLSLAGIRTWLRHSLQWEVPDELLAWFYAGTRGLPGRIRRALALLLRNELLVVEGGSWTYRSDLPNLSLDELIDNDDHAPRHNLPLNPNEFIGREEELYRLKKLIREERLVSIVGPDGLGKTRLARQVAAESLAFFPDGVYFVSLDRVHTGDGLVFALADVLSISLYGVRQPREQILEFLRGRSLLLVLDAFDTVQREEEFLLQILERAREVRIITTSQRRLSRIGAQPYQPDGLRYPAYDSDPQIETYSAVQLFVHNARKVVPDFTLTRSQRIFVARICRLLGGMPLGIELATAWLRTFSCEDVASQLKDNLLLLEDAPHQPRDDDNTIIHLYPNPARQTSLLAIIESFWHQLGSYEQRVLQRLSIFRSGFASDAARMIADASPFFLDALVLKGYLRYDAQQRYEIHELLRQYAEQRFRADVTDMEATADRHAEYYLRLVATSYIEFAHSKQPIVTVTEELDNVRAAWDWAAAQQRYVLLEHTCHALAAYYEVTGLSLEGERRFGAAAEQVLAIETTMPEQTTARMAGGWLSVYQARLLFLQGDYEYAMPMVQSVVSLSGMLGAAPLEGYALRLLGEMLFTMGQYDDARSVLNQGMQIATTHNLPDIAMDCERYLGVLESEQGFVHAAMPRFEAALQLTQQHGDLRRKARVLNELGIVTLMRGQHYEALTFFEEYLQLTRDLREMPDEAVALLNLGSCLSELGRYSEALQHLNRGLQISRDVADKVNESITLENIGRTLTDIGDYDNARGYFDQVFALCSHLNNLQGEGYALYYLGLLHALVDDYAFAQSFVEQARQIGGRLESQDLLLLTDFLEGRVLMAQGHAHHAVAVYERALAVCMAAERMNRATEAQIGLAHALTVLGDGEQAAHYRDAAWLYLSRNDLCGPNDPLSVYVTMYTLMEHAHDDRAEQVLSMALSLWQTRRTDLRDREHKRLYAEQVRAHRDLRAAARQRGLV